MNTNRVVVRISRSKMIIKSMFITTILICQLVLSARTANANDLTSEVCPENHQCGSGECLHEDAICDGRVDCRDASDESNCTYFSCPSYAFKCDYGACINSDYVCDGQPNCKDHSDESTRTCGEPPTTQSANSICSKVEFLCKSGECIADDLLCDGKKDCRDSSDEEEATCWRLLCPGYAFRCDYGGCINAEARCNGVQDCLDGSDEDNCNKKHVTYPTSHQIPHKTIMSCKLPSPIKNGKWSIYSGGTLSGDKNLARNGTTLLFRCDPSYKLHPNDLLVICNDRQWDAIPQCTKMCPELLNRPGFTQKCFFENKEIACEQAGENAYAVIVPKAIDIDLEKIKIVHCANGAWNPIAAMGSAQDKTVDLESFRPIVNINVVLLVAPPS